MFELLPRPHLTKKFHFFCKKDMAHPIPGRKIFFRVQKKFIPPKLAVFWGFRHFPKIEGPFPKFTFFDHLFFAQKIVWKPSVILLLCMSHLCKLLVPLSWPFFSIYNSNDKLEQPHLVFVFNKNHNAPTLTIGEKLFPELRDRPSILGKGPSPKKTVNSGGKNAPKMHQIFFTAS